MTKTDTDRYDQTLNYIRSVSQTLANKVDAKVAGNKQHYGQLLSLGAGNASAFWGVVSNQHHAIRAVVLCQNLFLPPANCNNLETVQHFKSRSEGDVKAAVLIYEPKPVVTLAEFRATADSERPGPKNHNRDNLRWLTRKTMMFDGATNCYGAVNVWLVKSGLCSLDWYMNSPCNAYNVNQIIGDGQEWPLDDLGTIPAGWIFNIHDSADKNICHWGVVLDTGANGVKWAVASNTEAGFLIKKKGDMPSDDLRMVTFRRPAIDNGVYGQFDLATSIRVCEAKYNSGKVKLRVLDPTQHRANYF